MSDQNEKSEAIHDLADVLENVVGVIEDRLSKYEMSYEDCCDIKAELEQLADIADLFREKAVIGDAEVTHPNA